MNTQHAKEQLLQERATVEKEMRELGVRNSETGMWETSVGDIDTSATEPDEVADRVEAYEERQDELDALQARKKNIEIALDRIENGSYGTCAVCETPIEEARLESNPATVTCVVHSN